MPSSTPVTPPQHGRHPPVSAGLDPMVLTTGVVNTDFGHTRRRVLAAAALLGAASTAGCGLLDDDPGPAPAPDPLQPVLDEALALAAAYDRVALARPGQSARLTALAADHRAHAAELARLIGAVLPSGAPSAAASVASGRDSLADLRRAEQRAVRTATAACGSAAADRVMLVGSIAACRATHAEALR